MSHLIAPLPGGIYELRIRGAITSASLEGVGAAMGLANRLGACATIQDWRHCIVALTDDDLKPAPDWVASEPALALPTALVVGNGVVDLFQAHARRMAMAGVFRRVFLDPAAAREWALDRAAAR